MSFSLYRSTTLGRALDSTICELIRDGTIPPQLHGRIMAAFDKHANYALDNRTRAKMLIKAEKLLTYRLVDNVWTFILEDVEFSHPLMYNNNGPHNKVKIVACDASIQKRQLR